MYFLSEFSPPKHSARNARGPFFCFFQTNEGKSWRSLKCIRLGRSARVSKGIYVLKRISVHLDHKVEQGYRYANYLRRSTIKYRKKLWRIVWTDLRIPNEDFEPSGSTAPRWQLRKGSGERWQLHLFRAHPSLLR